MVLATSPAVGGSLTMAAPSAVFTIGRVAAMLGEDEECWPMSLSKWTRKPVA
jgi:hypothetical protein